jgi:hypothetical protein
MASYRRLSEEDLDIFLSDLYHFVFANPEKRRRLLYSSSPTFLFLLCLGIKLYFLGRLTTTRHQRCKLNKMRTHLHRIALDSVSRKDKGKLLVSSTEILGQLAAVLKKNSNVLLAEGYIPE